MTQEEDKERSIAGIDIQTVLWCAQSTEILDHLVLAYMLACAGLRDESLRWEVNFMRVGAPWGSMCEKLERIASKCRQHQSAHDYVAVALKRIDSGIRGSFYNSNRGHEVLRSIRQLYWLSEPRLARRWRKKIGADWRVLILGNLDDLERTRRKVFILESALDRFRGEHPAS
jgi:hypothetical protein